MGEQNAALTELEGQVALLREYFKLSYDELSVMTIALDDDPISKGLVKLHEKISMIREKQNRTATIFQKAIKIRALIQRGQRTAKSYYNAKFDVAFSTQVKEKGVAKEEREATARISVQDHRETLDKWEDYLDEARAFHDVAKLIYDNLSATKDDILSQITVIKEQIMIGEIPLKQGINGILSAKDIPL